MQEKRSHMFDLLHLHLPGPSDDVKHSAYIGLVFKQHPRDPANVNA